MAHVFILGWCRPNRGAAAFVFCFVWWRKLPLRNQRKHFGRQRVRGNLCSGLKPIRCRTCRPGSGTGTARHRLLPSKVHLGLQTPVGHRSGLACAGLAHPFFADSRDARGASGQRPPASWHPARQAGSLFVAHGGLGVTLEWVTPSPPLFPDPPKQANSRHDPQRSHTKT